MNIANRPAAGPFPKFHIGNKVACGFRKEPGKIMRARRGFVEQSAMEKDNPTLRSFNITHVGEPYARCEHGTYMVDMGQELVQFWHESELEQA